MKKTVIIILFTAFIYSLTFSIYLLISDILIGDDQMIIITDLFVEWTLTLIALFITFFIEEIFKIFINKKKDCNRDEKDN